MKPHKIPTPMRMRRIGTGRLLLTFFALTAALICNTALLSASEIALENEADAAITSEVKRSLLYHLLIYSKTQTCEGVVTLSGQVDNPAEKLMGTRLATGIKGVKSVINNMAIPTTLATNDVAQTTQP